MTHQKVFFRKSHSKAKKTFRCGIHLTLCPYLTSGASRPPGRPIVLSW